MLCYPSGLGELQTLICATTGSKPTRGQGLARIEMSKGGVSVIDSNQAKESIEGVRNEIEASQGTRIWGDYINALKLISQVVFTRSSGFILELIQNAEDAGLELENPGLFEIRINKDRVKVVHNGRPFSEENVGHGISNRITDNGATVVARHTVAKFPRPEM